MQTNRFLSAHIWLRAAAVLIVVAWATWLYALNVAGRLTTEDIAGGVFYCLLVLAFAELALWYDRRYTRKHR